MVLLHWAVMLLIQVRIININNSDLGVLIYDARFRLYYQVYTRVTVLQVLHYLYVGVGLGVGLGLVYVTLCNNVNTM
jgi:hypothetical protein